MSLDDDWLKALAPNASRKERIALARELTRQGPAHTQEKFWKNDFGWPEDVPGYIFLARAFDRIGRAVFNDKWTGDEWDTEFLNDASRVSELTAFASAWNASVPGKVKRRDEVMKWIRDHCSSGELVSAAWAYNSHGSKMEPLTAAAWTTPYLSMVKPRFTRCRINIAAPFSDGIDGVNFWPIYLRLDTLDACLITLATAPVRYDDIDPGTQSGSSAPPADPRNAIKEKLKTIMLESPTAKTCSKRDVPTIIPGASDLSQPEIDALWKSAAIETGCTAWLKGGAPRGSRQRHRAKGRA